MGDVNIILKEEINNLNSEQKSSGCLMLDLTNKILNWDEVISIIDPADVYDDESHEYGVNSFEPHCTILYGFKPLVTASQIEAHLSGVSRNINLSLLGVDIFPGGDSKPYDVVKFKVQSRDLTELNKLCKELPNDETFPNYVPHITIAYVKSGTGERYIKNFSKPQDIDGNTLLFSTGGKFSQKTKWKIKKKYEYTIDMQIPLKK